MQRQQQIPSGDDNQKDNNNGKDEIQGSFDCVAHEVP
jgi:hypothetical protein